MNRQQLAIIILSSLLLAASISPFLYRNWVTPEGRIFAGTQFFSGDWGVYVSAIRQGYHGKWTLINKYTSETHPGSLFHFHYLFLGKIGHFLGLSPVLTYHLSRLFLGALFVASAYLFLKECFQNSLDAKRLTLSAFLLALFAGGFPYRIVPEPAVFIRYASQPHFLIGSLTLLLIFLWFLKFLKSAQPKYLIFSSLLIFFNSLAAPAMIISTFLTLGIFLGFLGIFGQYQNLKKGLIFLITCGLAALPAAWYLSQLRQISPWSSLVQFDLEETLHATPKDWFFSLGPMALLVPFTFLKVGSQHQKSQKPSAISHQPSAILSLSFLLASYLLIFHLYKPLKINRTRFWHAPAWIAFAHLSAIGITKITHLINQNIKKSIRISRYLPFVFTSLIILISFPNALRELATQYKEYQDFSTLVYPKQTQAEAFTFLEKETHPDQVVLALYEASSNIPPLAGNTVYAASDYETIHHRFKVEKGYLFFKGKMNQDQARLFLESGNINLVWIGFQEAQYGIQPQKYPFLEKIFDNQEVKIYKIKNS